MSAKAPSAALCRMYKEIKCISICSQLSIIPGSRVVIMWDSNVSVNFGQDGHLITVTFGLHSAIPVDTNCPTGVKGFLSCFFPLGTLDIYFLFSDLWKCIYIYVLCLVTQSYQTVCNPMDYSPPCFSIHGILQARILEWVAMPSSGGSCQSRDLTQVFRIA